MSRRVHIARSKQWANLILPGVSGVRPFSFPAISFGVVSQFDGRHAMYIPLWGIAVIAAAATLAVHFYVRSLRSKIEYLQSQVQTLKERLKIE